MAKLWSSIRIPPTQLSLAALVLPRHGKNGPRSLILRSEWCNVFPEPIERGRIPKSTQNYQKYAFGHWSLIQDITEEKILFYYISRSYQGVPRLKTMDASFHAMYVWLKWISIVLTVKILNSNVHLMIEEGMIWDLHKSLFPFFIAAAQTQGKTLPYSIY